MTDNNNIENLFKDAFDKYEAPVDASVWKGVEEAVKNIPAPAAPVTTVVKSFSIIKSIVAVVSVATVAIVTYSVLKPKSPEAIQVIPVTNEIVVGKNDFTNKSDATFPKVNNSGTITKSSKKNDEKNLETNVSQQTLSTTIPQQENIQPPVQDKSIPSQEIQASSSQPKAPEDAQPVYETEQKPSDTPLTDDPDETSSNGTPSNSPTCIEPKLANFFSPNNDDQGDTYYIKDSNFKEEHVKILDLRGKIIKQWDKVGGFWDGKLPNGDNAEIGTYMVIINAICENGAPYKKKINIFLRRQ